MGDALYDVCPIGWRMPKGGNAGEYKSLYDNGGYTSLPAYRESLHLPFSGYYYNTEAGNQGTHGSFWSSSLNGKNTMYDIIIFGSSINLANTGQRYNGVSIRCIANNE